ncbi:MAG: sugar-transfer associated ATP-grasp domain-containing protein [Lentimicrobiaceae bacterium]|jgi:hypothetical protein
MQIIKKQLIKILVNRNINRISQFYIKQINGIEIDRNYVLDPEIINKHKKKWSKIFRGKIDLRWLQLYSERTKINSQDFVPENVYYAIIEPILNKNDFSLSYSDKNIYDLLYPDGLFPETIIRNIDGSYYNDKYLTLKIANDEQLLDILKGNDIIIIKPSIDSGGGKDVESFMWKDQIFINSTGQILTFKYLEDFYKQNFVIQKYLHQHPFLKQFNSTSVNTIRVLTYRSPVTNSIQILHCLLRVGAKNHHVDNTNSGGYLIGVNLKGELNNFAINKYGQKFQEVNEINMPDTQFIIPCFDMLQATAKEIAARNIHHKLLGLDMTIDNNNNIRCIEVNNENNGINGYQSINGTLFGQFTDEVVEYCESNMDKLYEKFEIDMQ